MKNLTEKAILVNVNISQWTARKYDNKVTSEVNKKHKTKDAGRFNKILIGAEHLKSINQIAGKIRTFHYENTLPWSDTGERLLTSMNYFKYIEELSQLKNSFETEVDKFVKEYPSMIVEAKANLNGLFNEKEYPKNVGERFTVKSSFMPIPVADDIRINVSDKEVSKIKEQVAAEVSERFATAQRDVYARVKDQLEKMNERLSDKDGIFRDSLFQNCLALVDLLPRLNVAEDKTITELCADLKSLYCDPEQVRTDVKLRKQKVKEVDAMLAKIESFF